MNEEITKTWIFIILLRYISFLTLTSPYNTLEKLIIDCADFFAHLFHMVRYRPNVAALMIDVHGNLLICERSTIPGAWQFPQGGVDLGEDTEQALYREIREEIGLRKEHYEILKRKDGYRYLYPTGVRSKKIQKHGNHGQEQTYFLCKVSPDAPEIDVNQTPREFRSYRWIHPTEFDLDWLPTFKHEVYRSVMKDFFNIDLD